MAHSLTHSHSLAVPHALNSLTDVHWLRTAEFEVFEVWIEFDADNPSHARTHKTRQQLLSLVSRGWRWLDFEHTQRRFSLTLAQDWQLKPIDPLSVSPLLSCCLNRQYRMSETELQPQHFRTFDQISSWTSFCYACQTRFGIQIPSLALYFTCCLNKARPSLLKPNLAWPEF